MQDTFEEVWRIHQLKHIVNKGVQQANSVMIGFRIKFQNKVHITEDYGYGIYTECNG